MDPMMRPSTVDGQNSTTKPWKFNCCLPSRVVQNEERGCDTPAPRSSTGSQLGLAGGPDLDDLTALDLVDVDRPARDVAVGKELHGLGHAGPGVGGQVR